MSSLIRTPITRQALVASKLRSICVTAYHYSNGATRHEENPKVLEKGKESILRKHSRDSTEKPRWREELASDAEAFVKSQRGEIDASEKTIVKLQNQTKDNATKPR